MGTLIQDLRYALRTLRRTPAFPLAAIGTLAIGIGATTAIFSTVNAALLKPLPYPDSNDLYSIRTTLTDGRVTTGNVAPVEIVRLNDPNLSIVRAAGVQGNDVTLLRDDGVPLKTRAYAVSEGFFELFGLPMTLGGFSKDIPTGNAPPNVIVSYRMWQDLYGGDPAVVGKPIRFAEITTTVAGVAPREFETPHDANFWFPIRLDPQGVNHSFEGFMRVKRGTTLERARSEMEAVMAGVARDFPASATARVYVVRSLVESIVGELGPILVVVLSATGLLLILACVNVTNLLLARGAARGREMAVRVALGAARGRIVRQLLTESILLATAGAVVGVFAAYAFVRLLLTIGASQLPRLDTVAFDGRVLLFALAALIVSGVLVGFAPALRLAVTDVRTLMNESGRSSTGGRATTRWLGALTIAEVALAVTLVAGAGWLVRSFDNLRTTDPGFVPDGRVVFDAAMMGSRFRDNVAVHAAFTGLLDRLRGLSGVVAAGSTFNFPLRGGPENALLVHLQDDPDAAHNLNSRQRIVSPGFFSAMGIKLVAGRDFTADDNRKSPPVVIINGAFARQYLSGKDPADRALHSRLSEHRSKDCVDHRRRRRRRSATFAQRRSRTCLLHDARAGHAPTSGRRGSYGWRRLGGVAHGNSRRRPRTRSADGGRHRARDRHRGLDVEPTAAGNDVDAVVRRRRCRPRRGRNLWRHCLCRSPATERSGSSARAWRDARQCLLAHAEARPYPGHYRRHNRPHRRVSCRSNRVRASSMKCALRIR